MSFSLLLTITPALFDDIFFHPVSRDMFHNKDMGSGIGVGNGVTNNNTVIRMLSSTLHLVSESAEKRKKAVLSPSDL